MVCYTGQNPSLNPSFPPLTLLMDVISLHHRDIRTAAICKDFTFSQLASSVLSHRTSWESLKTLFLKMLSRLKIPSRPLYFPGSHERVCSFLFPILFFFLFDFFSSSFLAYLFPPPPSSVFSSLLSLRAFPEWRFQDALKFWDYFLKNYSFCFSPTFLGN